MPILRIIALCFFLCFLSTNAHSYERSESFLFVGDSLSSNTNFAKELVASFENWKQQCPTAGSETTLTNASYALPSASPRHFIEAQGSNKNWLCKQKKVYRNQTASDTTGRALCNNTSGVSVFEKLIGQHSPSTTVIALGTNSMAFSKSYLKARVHEMLDEFSDESRCFWVPPTYVGQKYKTKALKTIETIQEAIDEHSKKCILIESYDEMKNQTKCSRFVVSDQIHHTSCGSQLWGEFISQKICQNWLE